MSPTVYRSLDTVIALDGEVIDLMPEGLLVRIPDDDAEDGWAYGLVERPIKPARTGPLGFLPARIFAPVS